MIGLFDHAYGFAPEDRLYEALAAWRAAGFKIRDECIRHRGGKLSGFAMMTGTYLELIAVVDEHEFSERATEDERIQRARGGPYALVAACRNICEVRTRLAETVPAIAPIDRRHVYGEVDGSPAWAVIELPASATPGADVSLLEYMRRTGHWATATCGDNGVYGIGGYYFCAADREGAVAAWASTFAPAIEGSQRERLRLRCGHQTLTWLSADEHAAMFGVRPADVDLQAGRLCAVGLLSACVEHTEEVFAAAGMTVFRLEGGRLSTAPDPLTGYAFVVEGGPGARQLAEELNVKLGA